MDEFVIHKHIIGNGHASSVTRGFRKSDRRPIACKKYSSSSARSAKDRAEYESMIYKYLEEHQTGEKWGNIPFIKGPLLVNEEYFNILQYANRGSFYTQLNIINFQNKIEIFRKIIECYKKIHKTNVFHVDVKPQNWIGMGNEWFLCDFEHSYIKNQQYTNKPEGPWISPYIENKLPNAETDYWSILYWIKSILNEDIELPGNGLINYDKLIENLEFSTEKDSISSTNFLDDLRQRSRESMETVPYQVAESPQLRSAKVVIKANLKKISKLLL